MSQTVKTTLAWSMHVREEAEQKPTSDAILRDRPQQHDESEFPFSPKSIAARVHLCGFPKRGGNNRRRISSLRVSYGDGDLDILAAFAITDTGSPRQARNGTSEFDSRPSGPFAGASGLYFSVSRY